MWNSITQFFSNLFSGSQNKDSVSIDDLSAWANQNDFKYESPAKSALHQEYDHLLFFQQGTDHQTNSLMRHRTPDAASIVAHCTLEHEGTPASYICYIFENTTISLPKLQFSHRESAMFITMRGSKLSPVSMSSNLSSTHAALCEKAKWGDRLFRDTTVQEILQSIDPSQIRWMEADDCHLLLVCDSFHGSAVPLGKTIFHHFAQFRYRKANS